MVFGTSGSPNLLNAADRGPRERGSRPLISYR